MSFKINAKRLCDLVDSFQGAKVAVFGDFILDEYIWGSVDRVSPEAPIVVVAVQNETYRLGGAANVANNLSSLGAQATLCSVIGNDQGGKDAIALLGERGISTEAIIVDQSRPTTRKTRVVAHSQQVVRVDRESDDDVSDQIFTELKNTLLRTMQSSRALIVSDYGKGVVTSKLNEILANKELFIDAIGKKKPVVVDPKGIDYSKYRGATCIKPNKKEATLITGRKIKTRADAIDVAELIKQQGGFSEVMITLGSDGLVLVQNDHDPYELDTIAQEVFDVSGAGDTVSAVYTLSLSVGATPVEASIIANCAAARVIREVGTATLDSEELKAVINFWEENS